MQESAGLPAAQNGSASAPKAITHYSLFIERFLHYLCGEFSVVFIHWSFVIEHCLIVVNATLPRPATGLSPRCSNSSVGEEVSFYLLRLSVPALCLGGSTGRIRAE